MLKALIHGKVGSQIENMEDVLTSSVFGTLEYMGSAGTQILLRFLEGAQNLAGARLGTLLPAFTEVSEIHFKFWPHKPDWQYCEPDVVITMKMVGGAEFIVLVEAKLWSTKSQIEDQTCGGLLLHGDQLAREWVELRRIHQAPSCLVYLTAHISKPHADMVESAEVIRDRDQKKEFEDRAFWLNWESLKKHLDVKGSVQCRDLKMVLNILDMGPFTGFGIQMAPPLTWSFDQSEVSFDFSEKAPICSWRFDKKTQ